MRQLLLYDASRNGIGDGDSQHDSRSDFDWIVIIVSIGPRIVYSTADLVCASQ